MPARTDIAPNGDDANVVNTGESCNVVDVDVDVDEDDGVEVCLDWMNGFVNAVFALLPCIVGE